MTPLGPTPRNVPLYIYPQYSDIYSNAPLIPPLTPLFPTPMPPFAPTPILLLLFPH